MTPATGRIVVVGLGSRTGVAVARRRLAGGATVLGTVRRPETADACVESIVGDGGGGDRLSIDRLDLADAEAIDAFCERISADGPIDALVVAAAPFEERPIESVTHDGLVDQASVQAAGPAMLAIRLREALAGGRDGAGGAIVLFGDIHARLRPRAGALPYLAGKAMLESLVPLLAVELAPVRVFGIAPGVIAWAEEFDEARRAAYLARVPLGREGTVEEAAALVDSMVDSMTYTTGIVVPIDGGRSLR